MQSKQLSLHESIHLEDLLQACRYLPIQGELVSLDETQLSYLRAAAQRFGVRRTWVALMRAVQTGRYTVDDVVRVTWHILRNANRK